MAWLGSLDRHSSYYSPQQYKIFQEDSHRQYFGIGIMIRKIESGVLVSKVFSDGPAELAGLQVGDLILKVNNEVIDGFELSQVSSKIKGVKGSTVNLELVRRNKNLTVTVKRGQIQVSTVDQFYVDENQTGYLHLIQFSTRSRDEVADALIDMKVEGMKSLVLDLAGQCWWLAFFRNRSCIFFSSRMILLWLN